MRHEIDDWWLPALTGALSIAFAVFLLITPGAGALVITWLIGWFAVFIGVLLLMLAFRILTVKELSWADVRPGAVVAAVAWTVLQAVGGYYVGHQLQGASEVYGTFAVVIGVSRFAPIRSRRR